MPRKKNEELQEEITQAAEHTENSGIMEENAMENVESGADTPEEQAPAKKSKTSRKDIPPEEPEEEEPGVFEGTQPEEICLPESAAVGWDTQDEGDPPEEELPALPQNDGPDAGEHEAADNGETSEADPDGEPELVLENGEAEPPGSATSGELPEKEKPPARARPPRKKSLLSLNLKELDRDLSAEQRQEWESIYASYRAKSVLSGTIIGADQNSFDMRNLETGEVERKTLSSLIIIGYRVKVLIPETELWYPGEERPGYVLKNMVGSEIDYVVMEVDREGEIAIGSRRMALTGKRRYFARTEHREGELMKCRVLSVGPKRCTVECHGFDVSLSQRDLSYTAIPDLRAKYHPGQELSCRFKGFDKQTDRLSLSVKEINPNPFLGADRRHPVGSRRHAVISGKYAGGVFCTLPDETVCLCLYSAQHADADFRNGDSVIVVIRSFDYDRHLIYGRILAKW